MRRGNISLMEVRTAMRKVFIGVGHGGSDPGACANGLRESDVNLEMALAMKAELERYGVTVGISRVKDENDRLAEEIRECNAFAPELAVEVHNNAGGGDGFECYISGKNQTARQLAERIEAEVKLIGQNSRGVKVSTSLGWVNKVKAPAVLCEGFFLDSADRAIADTAEKQRRFGQAYARGVLGQLGISMKPQGQQTPPAALADRRAVQERFGFDDSTMLYLDGYRFAAALYQRLAETK